MASLSRRLQWSIAVFIAATMVSAGIAYLSVAPHKSEGFFLLYALGEGKMLEHYFPNGNSTIKPGVTIQWYLRVVNIMGSAQYVAVKVKLGNATTQRPNQINATPAPMPALTEFHRILVNNETWEIPFAWKVTRIRDDADGMQIALDVNGLQVEPTVCAARGNDFRMIFELWTLRPGDDRISFGSMSGDQRQIRWLQLRFNVTVT